ncbi:carbohydrate-binding family 9-like protein [Desertivirga xinjiangensis]|uniref:carbohydrate-binding family 9-like protein n=1 Tax=Desertivirga xinjiangensis TaxID=539206 RepID=UPI002108ABC4|nr:carbohydrate-binding family 9-like protein [Pedobacter xinjiangensis]
MLTITHQSFDNNIKAASLLLDKAPRNSIDIAPWREYPYKPDASFSILYTDDSILLKYFVKEKNIKAIHYEINSSVHKDTCVEFFIAFDNEKGYYNLEFNCAGTCHAAYGEGRNGRELLPVNLIQKISYLSAINGATKDDEDIDWELTLVIPIEIFRYHQIQSLSGKKCRVNFYKCGDDLPEPHFLCWNDIKVDSPDFHLPEFFGEALFAGRVEELVS